MTPAVRALEMADLPHAHFIASEWLASDEPRFPVFDPSTGGVIAELPEASSSTVDAAVSSARQAFRTWSRTGPKEREALLHRIADLLEEDAERLAMLETLNCGKPLAAAREGDVQGAIDVFRFYAGYPTKNFGQLIPSDDAETLIFTIPEPVGVVAAITPWNYPLLIAAGKIAPALAAGCAVVVKPAPETPLTTLELASIVSRAGAPAGLLNVVAGGPDTGTFLSGHAGISKLSFTGSTRTSSLILTQLAKIRRPAAMELGGKSPNVVFEDVVLARSLDAILMGALYNAGQECCAGARILVHEAIADDFMSAVKARLPAFRVGPGSNPDVEIGPMVSERHQQRVAGFVDRAREEGASVLVTAPIPDAGYFYEPTVLVDLDPGMEVWREEVFGPVLAIDTFSSDDEALEKANATRYGLAAGIWTGDIQRALRFARELEAGQVWINSYLAGSPSAPFGGLKDSGWGRELGAAGLLEFCELKTVYMRGTL
jgi:phenylacetaldehyde dehydrogenase